MADATAPSAPSSSSGLLADLTDEQRAEIDARGYVKLGREVAWLEPGGRERREPLSRLYYVYTRRGVFRVSRLTDELVEV